MLDRRRRKRPERPEETDAPPAEGSVPDAVLSLQGKVGNAAVARAISSGRLAVARTNGHGKKRKAEDEKERPYNTRHGPRVEPERVPKTPRLREAYESRHGEVEDESDEEAEVEPPPGLFWRGEPPRWTDYENLLATKGNPVVDPNARGSNPRMLYTCAKCGNQVPRKQRRRGHEPTIDIDHHRDHWTAIKSTVDVETLTHDGHEFTGYPLAKAREAYNDPKNLVALCSACNRSKSGRKDADRTEDVHHDPSTCPACRGGGPPPKGPDPGSGGPGGGGGGFTGGGDPIAAF